LFMDQAICRGIRSGWLGLVCLPALVFSQSSLKGTVTDAKTGEPVPYANVFFINTTIGNATAVNGSYEIKNIPPGKFDLTVSVVGYTRFQKSIEFPGSKEMNIKLSPDPVELSEVTIEADQADTKKYFPVFQKYFLGQSANARSCEIKNRETVHLFYDKEEKILTGHASKPIVVENRRLGYRLYFILDNFTLDYKGGNIGLFGVPRFEDLPTIDKKDSVRRERRRLESFKGSMTHFMRALYSNTLEEEGFKVTRLLKPNIGSDAFQGAEAPINTNDYLTGDISKVFRFKGTLKVEYLNEYEPPEYRRTKMGTHQVSFITFRDESITIFENGFYMVQTSVFIDGYFGWSEKIGEMMPMSYYPPTKEDKK
jgi:hypothetical protein